MNSAELEKLFLEAYDRYADTVFRHVYYKIFDRELARELMQDAFMKTWEFISKGNEIENMKAFLFRVAGNAVVDEYRRKKELHLDELMDSGMQFASDEDVSDIGKTVDAERMVEAMDVLATDHRQVLIMRYVDGFSPKEIAEKISESENVVSVRVNRAVKKLKKYLKSQGYEV